FCVACEVEVAHEFVRYNAFAQNLSDVKAVLVWHAHEPREWGVDPAEYGLQRSGMAEAKMHLGPHEDVIRQRNHGDECDKHRNDVQRELKSISRSPADGVNRIDRSARHS